MHVNVEYIDRHKALTFHTLQISLPAFLKHAAIAGSGDDLGVLPSLARGIGTMLFYGRYIDAPWLFRFKGFQRPDLKFHDPTEIGDFSTLVGKTLADYLAKRLLHAKFTHTYEAAMCATGYKSFGSRPDFYCTTENEQFAMEAKGFSKRTISDSEMAVHKAQSASGPIPVNFSIASVTYNIYDGPRCKFHDPVSDNTVFHKEENNRLAKLYYRTLYGHLNDYITPRRFDFAGRQYSAFNISPYLFIGKRNRPVKLLFDRKIMKNIEREYILSDEYSYVAEEDIYLDIDGIGVVLD